jgi:glycosyltransferase involved in cell wall biosynthesis
MPRIDIGYAQAGFPFKLGEYLATGKPVIASSVSDIPELLKNRQDVMLVPPGNSCAIVDAVEFLIVHPEQAFDIGASGRLSARKLFDYREQGAQLNAFLRSIDGMSTSIPSANPE